MTYTFYCSHEGRYIIYDTASGAVIRSSETEAYICDALDPCGEALSALPEKCPSEIRYELARFASTEVSAAYNKIKDYYLAGLIYGDSDTVKIKTSGENSADEIMIPLILSNIGLAKSQVIFVG